MSAATNRKFKIFICSWTVAPPITKAPAGAPPTTHLHHRPHGVRPDRRHDAGRSRCLGVRRRCVNQLFRACAAAAGGARGHHLRQRRLSTGANIVKWPAGGWLHSAVLTDKASEGASLSAPLAPTLECFLEGV